MSKKRESSETRTDKSLKKDEKKIKKSSKEKYISSKKEKKDKSQKKTISKTRPNKKNFGEKVKNKKYKLKKMDVSDDSSDESEDEREDKKNKEKETENETESENEGTSEVENDDDDAVSTTSTDNQEEVDTSDDDDPRPVSKRENHKRKQPPTESQNSVKPKKSKKEDFSLKYDGWETNHQVATKDIDFSQWQTSHPARETFFIGPDNYIYHNASVMKKFVDALKKNQVDEKTISIPIPPMTKIISTNPRITLGVTGSRYISLNGEGFRVQPILYIGKEYVSCIYIYFFFFFIFFET